MFSVVVPLYDKGPHILRALDSVLQQIGPDSRVIVVNDASRDDGAERVAQTGDQRIRILHREVPGPGGYAARNMGVEAAESQWITFLDADDEWLPGHLETLAKLIQENPDSGFFSTAWMKRMADGSEIRSRFARTFKDPTRLTFEDTLQLYEKGMTPVHTNTVCVRRQLFRDAGGFPEGRAKRAGDIDTWFRIAAKNDGVVVSPNITARYNLDSVNMVTKTSSNVDGQHPLLQSVQSMLSHSTNPCRRRSLKRVANAATVGWMASRKRADGKVLRENIKLLYFRNMSVKHWMGLCAVLLLPTFAFRWLLDFGETKGIRGG